MVNHCLTLICLLNGSKRFEVVFWCLEWKGCTFLFLKIYENSFKSINTILWLWLNIPAIKILFTIYLQQNVLQRFLLIAEYSNESNPLSTKSCLFYGLTQKLNASGNRGLMIDIHDNHFGKKITISSHDYLLMQNLSEYSHTAHWRNKKQT